MRSKVCARVPRYPSKTCWTPVRSMLPTSSLQKNSRSHPQPCWISSDSSPSASSHKHWFPGNTVVAAPVSKVILNQLPIWSSRWSLKEQSASPPVLAQAQFVRLRSIIHRGCCIFAVRVQTNLLLVGRLSTSVLSYRIQQSWLLVVGFIVALLLLVLWLLGSPGVSCSVSDLLTIETCAASVLSLPLLKLDVFIGSSVRSFSELNNGLTDVTRASAHKTISAHKVA